MDRASAQQAPAGDPAVALGKPDGQDTFDKSSNWTTFDSQCFKSEVKNGEYVLTAKGVKGYSCWEVSWPLLENYYLEVQAKNPQACDKNDAYGILFRAPDNYRGYMYGLTCEGKYYLNLYDGQTTTELIRPSTSTAIQLGAGKVNRLGVVVYGAQYQLYANGTYLNQAIDSTYLEPGKIGFFVRAATDQPFTVSFDNLKVWLLDQNYYPPSQVPPTYPPVNPVPPASGAVTGTSTASAGLRVRTGPSTDYPILGTVPEGTQGEILGTSPDYQWYAVKVPTSVYGSGVAWVMAEYVTVSNPNNTPLPVVTPPPPPPPAGVLPPASSSAPTATFIETGVLRMGPGYQYPVYGTVNAGTKAAIVGRNQDKTWWALGVPTSVSADGTAWVYAGYITTLNATDVKALPNPALPANVTPSAPGSNAPAAVAIEPINVRSGPGNAYTSYGTIPIGTIMAVNGVSPDKQYWVVKLPTTIAKNGQGWVPARYTSATNTGSVPVIQPPPPPK
jgi:uncharacterized protein YraI